MKNFFEAEIACKYGIEEAIILDNLHFWVTKNECDGRNFYDGAYWTYMSQEGFQRFFPYFSRGQIRRILTSLEKNGLIMKGNFNETTYNRTTWYALTPKALAEFSQCIGRFQPMHWSESTNGMVETNQSNGRNQPIYYITDNNTDNNHICTAKQKKEKPVKSVYGKFENIKLTDEELETFKAEYPDNWERFIDEASAWLQRENKTRTNCLKFLRGWASRDFSSTRRFKQAEHSSVDLALEDIPF